MRRLAVAMRFAGIEEMKANASSTPCVLQVYMMGGSRDVDLAHPRF